MSIALRRADTTAQTTNNHRPPPSIDQGRTCARRSQAQLALVPTKKAGAKSSRPETVVYLNEQDQRFASWMNAAQAGDRAAYENLLRASIPFIKMVARRQGVPADFVDDVVQDTLLTVHRIRQNYDPSRPFTAWLRTIAQRRAIDIMRTQGRTSLREVYKPLAFENYSDPTDNPEDEADQIDRRNFLGIMVATLPTRQREAVEQLALNEKSLADASVATGLTPGALKVNLHRALSTLRARTKIENMFDGCNSSELLPSICDSATVSAHAAENLNTPL